MVPNKLKRHFTSKHGHLSEKPVEYFIQLSKSQKKQCTTCTKRMKTTEKAQEASYLVSQIIAKNKEPHTTAETTVLQSCCAIVPTMFVPELEKVKKIPLADNTIGRRIQHMSEDIKQQLKIIFKDENVMFALQLDESTDISGLSQLLVFIVSFITRKLLNNLCIVKKC